MIGLPLFALKLFFKRPKLFVLGVFPGVFTFAASCALVFTLWSTLLQAAPLWVSIPAMMGALVASWLVVGNLALLPVEDAILDECQRALWSEVRIAAPAFRWKRLLREAFFSLLLGLAALLTLLLALIPLLAPIGFLATAWLTAYGFLSPLFARETDSLKERINLFRANPISNLLLGAALNLLLFVPVLNVFLLGYAQVLAALLYFRRADLRD